MNLTVNAWKTLSLASLCFHNQWNPREVGKLCKGIFVKFHLAWNRVYLNKLFMFELKSSSLITWAWANTSRSLNIFPLQGWFECKIVNLNTNTVLFVCLKRLKYHTSKLRNDTCEFQYRNTYILFKIIHSKGKSVKNEHNLSLRLDYGHLDPLYSSSSHNFKVNY